MEKFIADLKKIIPFKDTTDKGDIVLVAAKEPPTLIYAVVTAIERDVERKDEWWHVTMSLLTVPPQQLTWTLRTQQMTGVEVFTMGGEERFFKAVEISSSNEPKPANSQDDVKKDKGLRRVK